MLWADGLVVVGRGELVDQIQQVAFAAVGGLAYTSGMYEVVYKRQATRILARMSTADRKRVLAAVEQLARSPRDANLDTKRLEGRRGFRLRVGGWRVLYDVEDDRLIILILQIGSRGDVYK